MITNKTKNIVLSEDFAICSSTWSKARGLMFRRKAIPLIFIFDGEARRDLHMMFVFFPIDVLFLDKEKKIVEIKQDFKPFTYYRPQKKSKYIIELPAGMADGCNTGDVINF